MDGFEYNKIFASLLIALLVAIVAIIIGEEIINPQKLKYDSYKVIVSHSSNDNSAGEIKGKEPPEIEPFLFKADIKKGEDSFRKCIQCHTTGEGEPHKLGPNLWDVFMRKIASLANYAYSSAMKEKNDHWTYKNLNLLLFKPRSFAPGTKMSFVGIFDSQERANIIMYLRSLSNNPKPLPEKK